MNTPLHNYVISEALKDKIITQDEFNIIFIDKADWFAKNADGSKNWEKSTEKRNVFWAAIDKLQPYFLNTAKYYDYNDVVFPQIDLLPSSKSSLSKTFTKLARFSHAKFYGIANFSQITFEDYTMFDNAHFYDHAIFLNTTFQKDVSFQLATFHKDAALVDSHFETKVAFIGTTFKQQADFINSNANKILFTNAKINKINLFAFTYDEANFLNLHNYTNMKSKFTTQNCTNRETARIIKASLEKENNILEANKYFFIEQELYMGELLKTKNASNKIPILITLYLNKWISNFGTDWIRSLFFLLMISYLFMRFYINFDEYLGTNEDTIQHFIKPDDIRYIWAMFCSWGLFYLSTYFNSQKFILWILIAFGIGIATVSIGMYDNVLGISNYIVQLTNPINAFKNMNLYEGIEIYGAIVRITIVTIIYLLIVAFRQNTRRK